MSKYLNNIKYIFVSFYFLSMLNQKPIDPSIIFSKEKDGYVIKMDPKSTDYYFENRYEKTDLIKTDHKNDFFFTESGNFIEFSIPKNAEVHLKFYGHCIFPIFFTRDPNNFSDSIWFSNPHKIYIYSDRTSDKMALEANTEISEIFYNQKKIQLYMQKQMMIDTPWDRIGVVYCLAFEKHKMELLEFEASWEFLHQDTTAPVVDPEKEDPNIAADDDEKPPITDPTTDPKTDPTTDPITDPKTDSTTDPKTDPTTDSTTGPTTDPKNNEETQDGNNGTIQENIEEVEIPDEPKVTINEDEIILDMNTGGSEVFYEEVFSIKQNEIKKITVNNLLRNTEIKIKDLKENFMLINLLYDQDNRNINQKLDDKVINENMINAKNLRIHLKLKDNVDSYFSLMAITSKDKRNNFWNSTNTFIIVFVIIFTIIFIIIIFVVIFYKRKKKLREKQKKSESIISENQSIPSELIPVYKIDRKETLAYKSEMSRIKLKNENQFKKDNLITFPDFNTQENNEKYK